MASRETAKPAPKKPSGAMFIVLGLIAILAAAFFFTTYAINSSSARHFQYEGRDAQGMIESLALSTTKVIYVSYSYTDDFGHAHHGSDAYPLADAASLRAGQPIDIIYLGPNPDKSRISAHQAMMMNQVKFAPWSIIGSMAAGGMLSLVIGVRVRNRRS